jgi:hypothetical protein
LPRPCQDHVGEEVEVSHIGALSRRESAEYDHGIPF